MKKCTWLYHIIPALGIPGFVMYRLLYDTGIDDRGLLTRMHPMTLGLAGLFAVAALASAILCAGLKGSREYGDNFSPSLPAALGCLIMAGGMVSLLLEPWEFELPALSAARTCLGWAAAAAFVWMGVCRLRGRMPYFGICSIPTVFFAVELIMRYKGWSSNPQFMDYAFRLGGSLGLLLSGYYITAFSAGIGSRRMLLFTTALGCCFCLTAAAGGENWLFWLASGIYLALNRCRLTPMPTEET